MIKIDIKKIDNWEEIKECHNIYFERYIKEKIEEHKDKYRDIYDFLIKNLDVIAVGEMSKLKEEVIDFYSKNIKGNSKKYELIKEIFNYNNFIKNKNKIKYKDKEISWNRHKLISLLGIRTCPYCNRQYITNYFDHNQNKTSADLDHFISKSEYPILALSLYNFIPSCLFCNQRLKGNKESMDKIIYPYEEDFGDSCKFDLEFNIAKYIYNNFKNEEGVNLKLDNTDSNNAEKIKKSIELFKLSAMYQAHSDYALEIIKKLYIYNEDMIKSLYNQYSYMFDTEDDIKMLLLGNYFKYEDLDKRPLSKLTKDLFDRYGF
ncbi:hypothetical protein WG909_09280 [Peptostreptococcaceae bacterium AGR-M142]